MNNKSSILLALFTVLAITSLIFRAQGGKTASKADKPALAEDSAPVQPTASDLAPTARVEKSEIDWKTLLTPAQFKIMRGSATEKAGSSPLLSEHRRGVFHCAGCGAPLFASDSKFESGTGWPSFTKPFVAGHIVIAEDSSFFMKREEVRCARCGSHLGHVFDDGPPPTGQRYCLNGATLTFESRP